MNDDHPLRKIISERRKEFDKISAQAVAAQKHAENLAANLKVSWSRAHTVIDQGIERANAVLREEGMAETFKYEDLPQPGTGNLASASLQLNHPSRGTLVDCDIAVSANDGNIVVHYHNQVLHGHEAFAVETINNKSWAEFLSKLYDKLA